MSNSEDLAALQQEVAELRKIKLAFDAQNELASGLVTMSHAASSTLIQKSLLLQIVKLSASLTASEETSVFLLDANRMVTESILARGATVRELKQILIGQALDKGLAGWVCRHLKVGLVEDTETDDRWIKLPLEPYTVRSALCVPLLMGKTLLGVITMMHPQPKHFTPASADLMQKMAAHISVALESARLLKYETHPPESAAPKRSGVSEPTVSKVVTPEPSRVASTNAALADLGIYMIVSDGSFLYVNPRLAEIFEYTFSELLALKSIFALIVPEEHQRLAEQIQQCLHGQIKNLSCRLKGQQKNEHLIEIEIYGTRTKFYGKSIIIGVLSVV